MFCIQCGKELNDGWSKCPYCGTKIEKGTGNYVSNETETEGIEQPVFENKKYKMLGSRRTGRFSFDYIPTDIRIEGDNVYVTTHRNKDIKSQFNKNEVESVTLPELPVWIFSDAVRLVIFGILLYFSYGSSIFAIIWSLSLAMTRHIKIKLKNGEVIKIPICQKADASDFLKELNYPDDEIEKNNAKKVGEGKWALREWLKMLILISVAAFTLSWGLAQRAKNMQSPPGGENEIVVQEEDISNVDFEKLLGQPEGSLKEVSSDFEKKESRYELLGGEIYAECDEEKVCRVMIGGDGKKAPNYHGVKIGMSIDEADALLKDTYVGNDKVEDKIIYVDADAGNVVMLTLDNDNVTGILAAILTEEEIGEFKDQQKAKAEEEKAKKKKEQEKKEKEARKEYIFPDSDKKYLTEDEVLKVDVDTLRIARNEIFARHGYIFNSDDLKKHFGSTSWYKGTVKADKFNSDKVFNDFEKKNVELIKRIEDDINGVVTAKNFIGIEGDYQYGSENDAGLITVWDIRDGVVYMDIGTCEYPHLLENVEGEIIDDHTVTYRGMEFIWTDTASLYVIDVPDIFSDVILEGADYLIPEYYNVS